MAQVILQKGGAGSGSDDCTAVAFNVLEGKTAIVNDGTDEPQGGTLLKSLVLEKNGQSVSTGGTLPLSSVLIDNGGTMPNNGGSAHSLNCGDSYSIPLGYHNGSGVVTANTLSSQTGVDNGKVAISMESVLTSYQGWVNGQKINGNMANNGAVSHSLNCGESYIVPTGYHNGNGIITASSLSSQTGVDEGKTGITSGSIRSGYQGWYNGNKITGSLTINSITSFNCAQASGGLNTVTVSFSIAASAGRPWTGLRVCGKIGEYPDDINDGFLGNISYDSLITGSRFITGNIDLGTRASEGTDEWYFKAWDYITYNTDGSSSYNNIQYGDVHMTSCSITRYPSVPYIVTVAGDIRNDVSGSMVVPAGASNMKVMIAAIGGYSGAAYGKHSWGGSASSENEFDRYNICGKSGGEGGQVQILDLDCSSGQTMSWTIGCIGNAPKGTSSSGSSSPQTYGSPWTQGTPGNDTTFTFNGTTYTCLAGNCGQAGNNSGSGGTGRPGADGGYGVGTGTSGSYSGETGGNAAQGTYFEPTGTRYGGGGAGIGSTFGEWTYQQGSYWHYGKLGMQDPDTYGHGGYSPQGTQSTVNAAKAPNYPGAIIMAFY